MLLLDTMSVHQVFGFLKVDRKYLYHLKCAGILVPCARGTYKTCDVLGLLPDDRPYDRDDVEWLRPYDAYVLSGIRVNRLACWQKGGLRIGMALPQWPGAKSFVNRYERGALMAIAAFPQVMGHWTLEAIADHVPVGIQHLRAWAADGSLPGKSNPTISSETLFTPFDIRLRLLQHYFEQLQCR